MLAQRTFGRLGVMAMAASLVLLAGGCSSSQQTNTTHRGGPSSQAASAGVLRGDSLTFAERGPGIEKFFRIRAPGRPTFMPDGSLFVSDLKDGVPQVFRVVGKPGVPVTAKTGGPMDPVTNFKDGATGYSVSPDFSKVLVYTAAGGNEKTQAYLMDQRNTNPATNLTPVLLNPEVVHGVNLWLNDSSGFIFTANDANPNDFYIYRYDFVAGAKDDKGNPAPGRRTRLLGKPGSWSASDITRDTSRLLVEEFRSASDSSIYELGASSGDLKSINAMVLKPGQTASISAVGYTPDEKQVFVTSDHEDGRSRLFLVDLATGQVTKPIPELDRYELDGAGVNEERTLLTVSANVDGYSELRIYHLPDLTPAALPQIPKGLQGVASLRGNKLIYSVTNANTPGLAYAYTVPAKGQAAGAVNQVTFADDQGVDLATFRLPELITYKSADGLGIPAFLYLPAGATKGRPVPFVINYHGGPEGQSRPGFDRTVQYLVSEGFGVMQPNVRGSTGYGREFHMMDDYKNRWLSVKDGVDAAKWLVDSGYARPGKIAAYGGSYGGYMATATLVEDQERVERGEQRERLIGASINVVGVVNLKTFLENTSGYRRKLRENEYGPLSDPQFLDSVSPLLRAEKINVPMLIAHGLNDPRVPMSEAMQLAEALQARGLDPEQVYFYDEGHGFAKLDNRLLFSKRMTKFLKAHIGE
jgi:dipeptidyl aminopeptidase/acylaminoacyl peptidase